QAFSNLILNAVQSMREGGRLIISTKITVSNQVLNYNNHNESGSMTIPLPKEFICVTFIDTGNGISPKDLKKIFLPFYTTKKKGTGLGLTITHRIIEAHKGRIEVESKTCKNTKFSIFLPLLT
ncbi:MAG: ATP-binding protein, partial [Thermodesulfobacteriota bacterium]|nr:ATP-binding protein [Thermodesulfobacteriota bacterium]